MKKTSLRNLDIIILHGKQKEFMKLKNHLNKLPAECAVLCLLDSQLCAGFVNLLVCFNLTFNP